MAAEPVSASASASSASSRKSWALIILLGLLFLACFSLPFLLIRVIKPQAAPLSDETLDPIFWKSLEIYSQDEVLVVKHSPDLHPKPGSDFALVMWFKLKRLPESGQRMVLAAKYVEGGASRPGYSLAISRDQTSYRPSVYWRDTANRGGWYDFAEMQLLPNTWTLLAVTFRDGKLLGVHTATKLGVRMRDLRLLGGYKFNQPLYPSSAADLRIAPNFIVPVKMRVAMFAIFSVEKGALAARMEDLLKEISKRPYKLGTFFKPSERMLWLEGEASDRTGRNQVTLVKQTQKAK